MVFECEREYLDSRQTKLFFDTQGGYGNARLSKSFLEDALMITLTADDIFHTRYHYMDGYGVRSHILTRSYNDNQRFGIQISYKFNATKSKYKGTGAGQSEKQRL